MLNLNLNNQSVFMTKFFNGTDSENALKAISESGTHRVLFIDTPATLFLVETIKNLVEKGVEVVVRDHHDAPNPSNQRQQEIKDAAQAVRDIVGKNALISDRETHPACSSLFEAGEFADGKTAIIADPDLDGLLASMKALGLVYQNIDQDANVLDGPRSGQSSESLSIFAWLLVRAMATLPMFDANRPEISENAKKELFETFVRATQGYDLALSSLESKVSAYEQGVKNAQELLANKISEIIPGVILVNTIDAPRFDLATVTQVLEKRAKVTVMEKNEGPIAKIHGKQFSLAVTTANQKEVNLQELLTPGFTSSPQTGIISNTTFLLHVNEEVWQKEIFPRLKARFEV